MYVELYNCVQMGTTGFKCVQMHSNAYKFSNTGCISVIILFNPPIPKYHIEVQHWTTTNRVSPVDIIVVTSKTGGFKKLCALLCVLKKVLKKVLQKVLQKSSTKKYYKILQRKYYKILQKYYVGAVSVLCLYVCPKVSCVGCGCVFQMLLCSNISIFLHLTFWSKGWQLLTIAMGLLSAPMGKVHQGYTKDTPSIHQGYTKDTPRIHQRPLCVGD